MFLRPDRTFVLYKQPITHHYIHSHRSTYNHTYIQSYIQPYIHSYIPHINHSYIPPINHSYIHTSIIHTYTHTYNHSSIHTPVTHSFIHTHRYILIHTFSPTYPTPTCKGCGYTPQRPRSLSGPNASSGYNLRPYQLCCIYLHCILIIY